MKGRTILLETDGDGRGRAALMVDGRLEDLLIDPPPGDPTPAPGDIFFAKIERLVPKQGGAFAALAPGRTGYLRDAAGHQAGAGLLVQVTGYAERGKAVPVTQRVLLKGRLLILTPGAPGIHASRQIADKAEAERLTGLVETLAKGAGLSGEDGLILRTAAAHAEPDELTDELAALLGQQRQCQAHIHEIAPGQGEAARTVRVCDVAMREWEGPVERGPGLFNLHGVGEAIDALREPLVPLASGGSMCIETTSALVAIDVNTGGDFSAAAGLKATLEAVRDLPRQLRMRGLGGQIVLDPAPLRKSDRKRVEDAVKTALRRDPVETAVLGWTPLGHLELRRKRERRPLADLL